MCLYWFGVIPVHNANSEAPPKTENLHIFTLASVIKILRFNAENDGFQH